jgi:hypothetical protein
MRKWQWVPSGFADYCDDPRATPWIAMPLEPALVPPEWAVSRFNLGLDQLL